MKTLIELVREDKNIFDTPFEFHSSVSFMSEDLEDLFRSIVTDYDLELEIDENSVLHAIDSFGELSFKRFESTAFLKWAPIIK